METTRDGKKSVNILQ